MGRNRTLAASAKVLRQNYESGHSNCSRPKPPCCTAHQGRLCAGRRLCKVERGQLMLKTSSNALSKTRHSGSDMSKLKFDAT